ncbi:hypothetical protein MPP7335_00045 [Mycolicibacterium parafortuitum]|uniref:Uncharacterized protein n=2 Tax=Mycolicibacterium parafortuitum TaxID=39692 RepID=A0A375YB31_MYCPF|nr:hypothetical protein MPP7335_00045 [Mycolicibacterium parafortuitum]
MSVALDTIVRTLESEVMSRVEDPYARGQLWASTGILANIAVDLRRGAGNAPASATPSPTDAESAAALLDSVRAAVAQQASLHYKKAASGA